MSLSKQMRLRSGFLLSIAAFAILCSCNRKSAPPGEGAGAAASRPRNLLLVTIDTLRADRLGCYGYAQVETPNLDRLARRGALFENAVAQAPLTAPSHASMMTGLNPTAHKVRDTGGFVLAGSETLADDPPAAGMGHGGLRRRVGAQEAFRAGPGLRRLRR